MAIQPIIIDITPPSCGWAVMTIESGDQECHINCTEIFDPFGEIHSLMEKLEDGGSGNVLINQEVTEAMLWIDREPASSIARLRVFEPGPGGRIEELHFDAQVKVDDLLNAWSDAAMKFMAEMESSHWDSLEVERLDKAVIEQMARRLRKADMAARRQPKVEPAFELSI